MPITILCPNNHKLTCPDSLAGKAGKCPHCGAKFKIPGPATAEVAGAAAPAVAVVAEPAAAAAPAKPAAAHAPTPAPAAKSPIRAYEEDGEAPGADEIVFLCPEGHHLCGPATLAGDTGECPTCHVKFIVPSPDEAVEPEEPEISLSSTLATADAPQGFSFSGGEEGVPRGVGALFAELWKYRAFGCAIELDLGEGRVMVPNGFAPESAGLSHGMFTASEPNGAATVSVISWSAIERINVRGMQSLPKGIEFDVP
jgi:hypothetical protein